MKSKILIIMLLITASGCIAQNTEVIKVKSIRISSPAFADGERIPAKYTCEGENVSPELSWEDLPAETKSIALISDDPDAPGGTFVHWVLYNIPPEKRGLPEGVPKKDTLADGSIQGMTNFGRPGYGGPCPPPGRPHRYFFKLYALDKKLELTAGASKSDVERTMEGHMLGKGELMGLYER